MAVNGGLCTSVTMDHNTPTKLSSLSGLLDRRLVRRLVVRAATSTPAAAAALAHNGSASLQQRLWQQFVKCVERGSRPLHAATRMVAAYEAATGTPVAAGTPRSAALRRTADVFRQLTEDHAATADLACCHLVYVPAVLHKLQQPTVTLQLLLDTVERCPSVSDRTGNMVVHLPDVAVRRLVVGPDRLAGPLLLASDVDQLDCEMVAVVLEMLRHRTLTDLFNDPQLPQLTAAASTALNPAA